MKYVITSTAGSQGQTGAPGATGLSGADGVTGSQGVTGLRGLTGPQGPGGLTGSGSQNYLAKWDTSGSLKDSNLSDTGSSITASKIIFANAGVSRFGSVAQDVILSSRVAGDVADRLKVLCDGTIEQYDSLGDPIVSVSQSEFAGLHGSTGSLQTQIDSKATSGATGNFSGIVSTQSVRTSASVIGVTGAFSGGVLISGPGGLKSSGPVQSSGLLVDSYLVDSYGATGTAGQALTQMGASGVRWLSNPAAEPTGFEDPGSITVSYDSTTQIVTLTGAVKLWYRNTVVLNTASWASGAHGLTTGSWFLYYGTSGFTWSQLPWNFSTDAPIAYVYFGTADKFSLREVHGLMPWQVHQELHQALGTYRVSGGGLTGYAIPPATDAENRPTISAVTVADEDIQTTNASLIGNTNSYTQLYFLTSAATPTFVSGATGIAPLNGTNIIHYNQNNGGTWQLTQMGNGNYMNVWVIAAPASSDVTSQKYRYFWLTGQNSFTSLSLAQAEAFSRVSLNGLSDLFTEFVPITQVTMRRTGALLGTMQIAGVQALSQTRVQSSAEGAQGPQGLQGITGSDGLQGVTGASGLTGLAGVQGVTGQAGTNGSQGTTGVQGLTGLAGITGASGVQGITGLRGITGTNGAQGITGANGVQGITGLQGPTGLRGITGTNGVQGPTGSGGLQGITGLPGVNAGGGTTNTLAKFTGATTIGNSSITDDGATVTFQARPVVGAVTVALTGDAMAISDASAMAIKAGFCVTGGGTITRNATTGIKWSDRFIVIDNGNGSSFGTDGYFTVNTPADGTVITGVGSSVANSVTVAGGYIPLASWSALYYILPIGLSNLTVNANFRVASYDAALSVPAHWILIALHNGDNAVITFCNRIQLSASQAYSETKTGAWLESTKAATGTGTVNAIPKYTAAGAIGNSNISDDGTRVSVGAALQVNSPFLIQQKSTAPNNQKFWEWGLTDGSMILQAVNDAYNAATAFVTFSRTGYTATSITASVPLSIQCNDQDNALIISGGYGKKAYLQFWANNLNANMGHIGRDSGGNNDIVVQSSIASSNVGINATTAGGVPTRVLTASSTSITASVPITVESVAKIGALTGLPTIARFSHASDSTYGFYSDASGNKGIGGVTLDINTSGNVRILRSGVEQMKWDGTAITASVPIHAGGIKLQRYVADTTMGAIYGDIVTPSSSNYSIYFEKNGATTQINGSNNSSLNVGDVPKITATSTAITTSVPVTVQSIAAMGQNGTYTNYATFGHKDFCFNNTQFGFMQDNASNVAIQGKTVVITATNGDNLTMQSGGYTIIKPSVFAQPNTILEIGTIVDMITVYALDRANSTTWKPIQIAGTTVDIAAVSGRVKMTGASTSTQALELGNNANGAMYYNASGIAFTGNIQATSTVSSGSYFQSSEANNAFYHLGALNVLNAASDNWLSWAAPDRPNNRVNLNYIGDISASATVIISGNTGTPTPRLRLSATASGTTVGISAYHAGAESGYLTTTSALWTIAPGLEVNGNFSVINGSTTLTAATAAATALVLGSGAGSGGKVWSTGGYVVSDATWKLAGIQPSTNVTYDCGTSSNQWLNFYATNAYVNAIKVGDYSTLTATTGPNAMNISSNFIPNTDISFDLGSSGRRWLGLSAKNLTLDTTGVGFFSVTPVARQSMGGVPAATLVDLQAKLASLRTALVSYGLLSN